jgi:hypothetical protein
MNIVAVTDSKHQSIIYYIALNDTWLKSTQPNI